MRRTKTGLSPSVDSLETRALLAAGTTSITPRALHVVVHDVGAILHTLARTGNTARASVQLTRLSAKVPSGPQGLAPTWRADLQLYRPHSAASVAAAKDRILADLYQFVAGSGTVPTQPPPSIPPPVNRSGLSATPAPGSGTSSLSTAPSLDSVTIQNATGVALLVTVHLDVPQVQKPWLTEILPAQGTTTLPFRFGTATGAFMTVDVSRADGGQSPPPLHGISLDQPMGGYNGTLFTVSEFGAYFNVTPG